MSLRTVCFNMEAVTWLQWFSSLESVACFNLVVGGGSRRQ